VPYTWSRQAFLCTGTCKEKGILVLEVYPIVGKLLWGFARVGKVGESLGTGYVFLFLSPTTPTT